MMIRPAESTTQANASSKTAESAVGNLDSVGTAKTTETANSPLVLNDPSRLEAGLEFPGLVIDPLRI
jgi:hypothetical protein